MTNEPSYQNLLDGTPKLEFVLFCKSCEVDLKPGKEGFLYITPNRGFDEGPFKITEDGHYTWTVDLSEFDCECAMKGDEDPRDWVLARVPSESKPKPTPTHKFTMLLGLELTTDMSEQEVRNLLMDDINDTEGCSGKILKIFKEPLEP